MPTHEHAARHDDGRPRESEPLGPVDYLVVEFPGSRLNGEGLPILVDLVDRRVIRLLDLLFVKKLETGEMTMLTMHDLVAEGGHGLGVFSGASSGLMGGDDLDDLAEVLEAGSSAAVVLYENLWAAPMASALRRSGAQLVAGGRIPLEALESSLDRAEQHPEQPLGHPNGTDHRKG